MSERPQYLITEKRDPKTEVPDDSISPVLVALPDTGTQRIGEAWMVDERDQWWAELPRPMTAADALAFLGLTRVHLETVVDIFETGFGRAPNETLERVGAILAALPKEEA